MDTSTFWNRDASVTLLQEAVAVASSIARLSSCRSRRGVVLWDRFTRTIRGAGFNGPPRLRACPGRKVCAGTCGQRSVHAEARAIREVGSSLVDLELVHVELAPGDAIVACDGPSCPSCAALILDVRFVGGVHLHEAKPPEWCPHREVPRADCAFCLGVDCIAVRGKCDLDVPGPCAHDAAARHGDLPVVGGRWRRYTAEEFYDASVRTIRQEARS